MQSFFPRIRIILWGIELALRKPAVAGHFYSGSRETLMAEVRRCFESPMGPGSSEPPQSVGKRTIFGALSPHAGYVFSGPVAAHVYRKLWEQKPPATVIILGPNHTGMGAGVAVATEDFETPFGVVEIDQELVKSLADDTIMPDMTAHAHEHSIEVQLPFMQYMGWSSKIVPISMALVDYDLAAIVGKKLRDAISDRDDVLVVASSDMSHYVPQKIAEELDGKAIDKMLKLDSRGLYNVVISKNITMCGLGPTISMIEAVRGSKATLLKYATSGDIQPMREVVGYAAVSIEK